MKFININRTDEECLNNVIKWDNKNPYITDNKKNEKLIRKLPVEDIRYRDNQLRIYVARERWAKVWKWIENRII